MDLSKLSDDDLMALSERNYAGLSDDGLLLLSGPQQEPSATADIVVPTGVKKGLRDSVDATAQLLEKALPKPAVDWLNEKNNWLASKGFPLEPIPEGGFSQQLKEQEKAYQDQRKADTSLSPLGIAANVISPFFAPPIKARGDGLDTERLVGNIASPANLAAASRLPQAATYGGKVLAGGTAGLGLGAIQQPAHSDDFWPEKAKQSALGGIGGAAVPAAVAPIAAAIKPAASQAVRALKEKGIPLTVGQRLGGVAKDLEDKLTSVPLVGKAIQNRRTEGYQAFNLAVIDEALSPIGKAVPRTMDTHKAIAYARTNLGKAYDELLPKMKGSVDDQFVQEINKISAMVEDSFPDKEKAMFTSILKRELINRMTSAGKMSGESLKQAQQGLRTKSEPFSKSKDAYQNKLGAALDEVRNSFENMLQRANPSYADDLKAINSGYAKFKRAQRAAASLGADEGMFTPAQLRNAARAMDKSKDNRAFSEGTALMQKTAENAKSVLPSGIPDSGTAGRMMASNPLFGGVSALLASPLAPIYSQRGQKILGGLLSEARPEFAQPVANFMRNAYPFLIPSAGHAGQVFANAPPHKN